MFENPFKKKADGTEEPVASRKITSERIHKIGDRIMSPEELGLVKDPETGMMVTKEELLDKKSNEDRNNP